MKCCRKDKSESNWESSLFTWLKDAEVATGEQEASRKGKEEVHAVAKEDVKLVGAREDHAEDRVKCRGPTGCHHPWREALKANKNSAATSHWVNTISWHLAVYFYRHTNLHSINMPAPRGHLSKGSSEVWTHVTVQVRSNKAVENGGAQCIMGSSLAASVTEVQACVGPRVYAPAAHATSLELGISGGKGVLPVWLNASNVLSKGSSFSSTEQWMPTIWK